MPADNIIEIRKGARLKKTLIITFAAILLVGSVAAYLIYVERKSHPIVPDEFCGFSTGGPCSSNSNCTVGGCSGQVCQSKSEEPLITTCEFRDCYDESLYDLKCKCIKNKCHWSK